jgi:hypothetical protein
MVRIPIACKGSSLVSAPPAGYSTRTTGDGFHVPSSAACFGQ